LEHLKVSKEAGGRVALLTLARPEQMNALSSGLLREVERAITDAEDSPEVRAVVVTGEGRAFCAGADIAELRVKSRSEAAEYVRLAQGVCNRIEACSLPVLAAVHGIAFGGGFELVLSCDLILAEERSRFGVPEVKLGLIPGAGGTQRLPRLVGRNRAKELISFGDPILADRALELGVVNRVVPEGEALSVALEWAAELSERAPLALEVAKRVINQGIQTDLRTGLELEAQGIALLFGTEDQVEGLSAFLEKRKAKFAGE
jgi:enoyl-CoA hydratase